MCVEVVVEQNSPKIIYETSETSSSSTSSSYPMFECVVHS